MSKLVGDNAYVNLANAVLEQSIQDKCLMKPSRITDMWIGLAETTYDYYVREFNKRMMVKRQIPFSYENLPDSIRPLIIDYLTTRLRTPELSAKYNIPPASLYRILKEYNVPYRTKRRIKSERSEQTTS